MGDGEGSGAVARPRDLRGILWRGCGPRGAHLLPVALDCGMPAIAADECAVMRMDRAMEVTL
jgi:hypothetical protein